MLCIIPARGGSKRLARKNLRPLAGKPLIAYSIEVALQTGHFEKVYVCTEDAEIADVARSYGAAVPFLMPEALCGDLVPSHVPCQHLAKELAKEGQRFDALLCLQPSSPLRSAEDVNGAARKFQEGGYDSLVSVTAVDPHYFHWAVVPEGTHWRMYFGGQYLIERPLLPAVFRPNGSIKIATLGSLAELNHFFGPRMGAYETPEMRSVHVAVEFDLRICEVILNDSGLPQITKPS